MSALPTVPVPGGRVEYVDVPGDPDRAPLLLLHEGLGSVGLWRGLPERIAARTGRRAVAYSRLGHGWSDPPPAPRTPRFMHEEAATVLPALREALDLDPVVLLGHSDGGSIALLHAPAAGVRGLVVIAPHVVVEETGLRSIAATRRRYLDGDLRVRMAHHHRDPDAAFWNWNNVWLDPAFASWDLRPELAGISCPTLAVQGTDDPYGTVVHVTAIRDGTSGPVRLLLLDGGHTPHVEHPDAVESAVAQFLDGLD